MGLSGSNRYIDTDDEIPSFEQPNFTGSPERNLLMAMLERAILDYVGNDKKESDDARQWIFGSNHPYEEYSFAWVCSELDLDPARISDTIASMPKRGNRKIAPWYYREEWTA